MAPSVYGSINILWIKTAFTVDEFAERHLTAALASRTSCITRGRGGWLDFPRRGLSPPILCQLPGALRLGSKAEKLNTSKCFPLFLE
jgi:hypothetical protein